MRSLILASLMAILIGTTSVSAQEVGQGGYTSTYCMTEADMKILAAAMTQDGEVGFHRVLDDVNSQCYDSSSPIFVTLLEKSILATYSDGSMFQFWKVEDTHGNIGYTYIAVLKKADSI